MYFGSSPRLGDLAKMLMSETSSLQSLYTFKAIAIKAAAGVCTDGSCGTTLCCSDSLHGCSHRKLRFFASPSDAVHRAAEAGSAAPPACSTYSLAVISAPRAPVRAESALHRALRCVHVQAAKRSPCRGLRGPRPAVHLASLQNGAVGTGLGAGCSPLQDKDRTKIQKGERYHRRKRRGEPCSNGEDRGVLSLSPRGDAYSSRPSLRGADATVPVPALRHTSGWRQAATLRNGVSVSKYLIQCLKRSQSVLKQDDSRAGGMSGSSMSCN